MPFNKPTQPTPASVGQITITINDETGVPAEIGARVVISVLDASGKLAFTWGGDLQSHLTTAQKTAIANLLSSIRTKAQTELL